MPPSSGPSVSAPTRMVLSTREGDLTAAVAQLEAFAARFIA